MDEIYPDTDTDDKNSPSVILIVPFFLSGYAMRILILIRRRGIGALEEYNKSFVQRKSVCFVVQQQETSQSFGNSRYST